MSKPKSVTTHASPALGHYSVLAAFLGLLGCLSWSYWPTLAELCEFWARNQDYSVGALVPPVALYLVWRQRAALHAEPAQPCWWGLLLLAFAEALRQLGTYYGVGSGERYALIASLAGVVLLAAGWRVCRRLIWVFAFLLLMIPLPARVHEALSLPLQYKATTSAVFALEALGFFVVREGNVLRLNEETSVAVAEACSGLRMLTAFVFVAAVLAFLIQRPRWHKLVLLSCSVPIAVLANAVRVVATSIFIYYGQNSGLVEEFHDAAGLAMMPLALLFSVALLKFLALLSTPSPTAKAAAPRSNGGQEGGAAPGTHSGRARLRGSGARRAATKSQIGKAAL